jgi:transposase
MVTLGVDAHMRTHTIIVVDDRGTPLGQTTVGTTSKDHLGLLRWAARIGAERRWAVEDCRHLSRADLSGICSWQENASFGCRRS